MKKLGIFGSTGSIGKNALQVVRNNPDRFKVVCLTANSNVDLLVEQALQFIPEIVCISDQTGFKIVRERLRPTGIQVLCGAEALSDLAREANFNMMVGAIVGFAGLLPTIEAIKAGKDIALANKETLVVAGEIVNRLLEEHCVRLIPIDSEHSALFQCLVGEDRTSIRKIILTASGGPFLHKPKEEFGNITVSEALKHPNWKMGSKITIDSATLMNKGLEVIEAHWLFGLSPDKIDVAIHPQSIIHSMVEFVDGSTKAQMGAPDMKVPIQYALSYPERIKNGFNAFNFRKTNRLDFFKPDRAKFKCLSLAYDALKELGTMPAVLNAANEVVVENFLKERIKFVDIPKYIKKTMQAHDVMHDPDLGCILEADQWARNYVKKSLGYN
ncbi:1-deoxy-D-xylulose-5-phosphate reductoisomerase [bacterium]|nr:1-deoxy-D-xylulose-5-phosphate reductoisomerase [bacterium]